MLTRTFKTNLHRLLAAAVATTCLFSTAPATAAIGATGSNPAAVGTCTFSLQLETPEYRAQFINLLTQAVAGEGALAPSQAGTTPSSNTPEAMYANIVNANYSVNRSALDVVSYRCLICHDGVTAPAAEGNYRSNPGRSEFGDRSAGRNHPIGMDYASYSHGNRSFKNSGLLDEKIMLIDGKVGCLSCHNPLNPSKNHLAVLDHKSSLCLSCHNK